ncbi:MAG: exodeoxyribonuclease 7 large subunit, partial [Candidatus Parcubacteria bacterium]
SLADYAADVRASTPTNAAELVVPDRREILAFIDGAVRHMDAEVRSSLAGRAAEIDGMVARIESRARRGIDGFRHMLRDFSDRFERFTAAVREKHATAASLDSRLASSVRFWSARINDRLDASARLLGSLDPRRPLEKGYALVRGPDGLVKDAASVDVGAPLDIQLHSGRLAAKVTGTRP